MILSLRSLFLIRRNIFLATLEYAQGDLENFYYLDIEEKGQFWFTILSSFSICKSFCIICKSFWPKVKEKKIFFLRLLWELLRLNSKWIEQ